MSTMSHPTSSLVIPRATKGSKANQTATKLPSTFPAGKTLGTRIVPGWGMWEITGGEKAASQPLLPQGLWESTALPISTAPALRGHPPSWPLGACGVWGSRAVSTPMVGKGGLRARWLLVVLAWELCSCPMQGHGTCMHSSDVCTLDPQG